MTGFRSLSRVSGDKAGTMAIKVFVCRGCGGHHRYKMPRQCLCGRMDFDKFDSVGEANRWVQLLSLERFGEIRTLDKQKAFPLYAGRPDGTRKQVARYVADYVYQEYDRKKDRWIWIIEDFKGAITETAILKLKMMEAQGTPVRISTSKGIMK